MKANELMIGDWVYSSFCDVPCRVLGIEVYDPTNGYGRVYVENVEEWKDVSSLIEIPLTPEILERNGFKSYIPEYHLETVYACQDVSKAVADELYALWPYQDGSFYLLLRVGGKDMVRMDVHYIHQLQHALRLCEIKKEIIL